jgi:membrane fusion protein (multidrug efflux system)
MQKLSDAGPAGTGIPSQPASRRLPWWGSLLLRLFLLILTGALVVLVATRWNRWIGEAVNQTTEDAYLQSDVTPLSAKVAGYIKRVDVDDYQIVHAGDLLLEIADDDYAALVAQA